MSPVLSASGRGDRRADLLPPELLPLFDDRFVFSCDLYEEYVRRLAVRIARAIGMDDVPREAEGLDTLAALLGLDSGRAPAMLRWLLGMLSGASEADPGEILEAQARHDPSALPSYTIAALAAQLFPDVLRGKVDGESALFAPEHIGAWRAYFANDNPLYAVSNRIGAMAVDGALPEAGGAVLELGGGLGSGAMALLDHLARSGRAERTRRYVFTDVAAPFLRSSQRTLAARFPGVALTAARLDMNLPFAQTGIEPASLACVYAVNTVHAARDLAFTLGEIREALAPGGAVVLSECVRPFAGRPVPVEITFNLLEAFRSVKTVDPWRPTGGFLTPEQWLAGFEACGFREARVYPDVPRIRDEYPSFIAAAVIASKA